MPMAGTDSERPRQPGRAIRVRDKARKGLARHFYLMVLGIVVAFGINRFVSPERFWAHWVALAWGVVFLVHLAAFSKTTMATMGGGRK